MGAQHRNYRNYIRYAVVSLRLGVTCRAVSPFLLLLVYPFGTRLPTRSSYSPRLRFESVVLALASLGMRSLRHVAHWSPHAPRPCQDPASLQLKFP